MVQALTKPTTLDDFLALPETKPASEYFDGTISPKSPRHKVNTAEFRLN